MQLGLGMLAPEQQVSLVHSNALLQTAPVAFSVLLQVGVDWTVSQ